jgi:predicted MFS family arabinose efflux permease
MRADLGWSFTDAGEMNTANAVGYLAGALFAAPFGRRHGDKRVFASGLLLTALTVGASALTPNFFALLTLRLIAGFTGALAFITGAALTSSAAAGGSASRAPTLFGVYFAGAGIGVTAAALALPPLLAAQGWRAGWLMLGILALAATIFGWQALRHVPPPSHDVQSGRGGWSPRFMACKLLAYTLFGAGYIAYATFIIAYLRADEHFSGLAVTFFWTLLGLAAVAASVTSFARRVVAPHAVTAAIATLTIAFGLGQCIGPVLSGALSDGPAGVRAGLWLSVGILAVAVIAAAFQPEPEVAP